MRWTRRSKYRWWLGLQVIEVESVITAKGQRFAIWENDPAAGYLDYVGQTKTLAKAMRAGESTVRLKGKK